MPRPRRGVSIDRHPAFEYRVFRRHLSVVPKLDHHLGNLRIAEIESHVLHANIGTIRNLKHLIGHQVDPPGREGLDARCQEKQQGNEVGKPKRSGESYPLGSFIVGSILKLSHLSPPRC